MKKQKKGWLDTIMNTHKIPLKLRPVPKNILWGGSRLKKMYGKSAPFDKIAESWELTIRDEGISVIDGGENDGSTLLEYISRDFLGTVGTAANGGTFPLLIKFIDAEDDLSVQVHPDDRYAASNKGESGKTEMWYIISADEGAELIYGVCSSIRGDEFKRAVRDGSAERYLRRVPVHAGDVFFIPSGQVHAICKGILLAEIQQNSNTTYRIYDYNRTGADGKKRELHIEKALDSIKFFSDEDIYALRFEDAPGRSAAHPNGEVLCNCKYFRVSAFDLNGCITFNVDERSFLSLLFIDENSSAEVSTSVSSVHAHGGDSIFIPAGCGEVTVFGHGKFLLSEL